jgi:hypothetical protein
MKILLRPVKTIAAIMGHWRPGGKFTAMFWADQSSTTREQMMRTGRERRLL